MPGLVDRAAERWCTRGFLAWWQHALEFGPVRTGSADERAILFEKQRLKLRKVPSAGRRIRSSRQALRDYQEGTLLAMPEPEAGACASGRAASESASRERKQSAAS